MMENRITKFIALMITTVFLITACQGTFERRPGEEEVVSRKDKTDHDPLNLKEDFAVITGQAEIASLIKDTSVIDSQNSDSIGILSGTNIIIDPNRTESYRIQLFTSKTYQPANTELNIAREVFDQPVWLDYEVPYYKVRVGDFPDRGSAEKYVFAAKDAGYGNAWVVKVNLGIRQLENVYDDEIILPLIDSLDVSNEINPESINDTTGYQNNKSEFPGE